MAKERPGKKSFQRSLEDIKEKMKEKRNKRLASANAPSRGRARRANQSSAANSTRTILTGVQLNNKTLALALQAEKEKVRQANAVMLQLKREQQALFLHLLLLKRKLREQQTAAEVHLRKNPGRLGSIPIKPQSQADSPSRKLSSQNHEDLAACEASPVYEDSGTNAQSECDRQRTLPSTVGVRRRRADRGRRRSERVAEKRSLSQKDPNVGLSPLISRPVSGGDGDPNQPRRAAEPNCESHIETEAFQRSAPEPVVPNRANQQPASRKQAQQQTRFKSEPAARKPERGGKQERVPLKKPWESSKPRTRSKSRDRSNARVKSAPPSQGSKLNTSLGCNDTFDFDCVETVHVTPFRAKAEGEPLAPPTSEEGGQSPNEASNQNGSGSSSPSSESEDSLYVPKTRWRRTSPDMTKAVTTRRGRPSKAARETASVPPKQEVSVFEDESSPMNVEPEKEEGSPHRLPESSPDLPMLEQENQGFLGSHRGAIERDCLPLVSPLVEAEMMRLDDVLSHFGDAPSELPPPVPHLTPQRTGTCKKRGLGVRTTGRGLGLCDVTNLSPAAYRKFTRGGSRPSDALCSTPAPARKRRCTVVVDYKEPTLNAKLRRGDKFTDLQFLQSPIFKQKSGRKSVQKSRNSTNAQKAFKNYNESFVGCR
ncbi:shugoshin 1 [Brachionichthys hirsutus]|uniref:shugoshin 1 n=1 Tax=Brachionichthys hirsutus TaxID=412623 RepID=UPI0036044BB5